MSFGKKYAYKNFNLIQIHKASHYECLIIQKWVQGFKIEKNSSKHVYENAYFPSVGLFIFLINKFINSEMDEVQFCHY